MRRRIWIRRRRRMRLAYSSRMVAGRRRPATAGEGARAPFQEPRLQPLARPLRAELLDHFLSPLAEARAQGGVAEELQQRVAERAGVALRREERVIMHCMEREERRN